MREYELTVIYDLAITEASGVDASVQALTTHVESRGGRMLRADRWGRRRMAYPINGAIDGDYIVSRVELDPAAVRPLQDALRIDERVYRHLVVRADELPPPPVPREPRRRPEVEPAPTAPGVAEEPSDAVEAAAPGDVEATAPVAAEDTVEPAAVTAPEVTAEAAEDGPSDNAGEEISTEAATVESDAEASA